MFVLKWCMYMYRVTRLPVWCRLVLVLTLSPGLKTFDEKDTRACLVEAY